MQSSSFRQGGNPPALTLSVNSAAAIAPLILRDCCLIQQTIVLLYIAPGESRRSSSEPRVHITSISLWPHEAIQLNFKELRRWRE